MEISEGEICGVSGAGAGAGSVRFISSGRSPSFSRNTLRARTVQGFRASEQPGATSRSNLWAA